MNKTYAAGRMGLLALLVTVLAIAPQPAAAGDCWACESMTDPMGGLPLCVQPERFGFDAYCEYYEVCVEGLCEWNCGPGEGQLCGSELALNGQVIPSGDSTGQAAWATYDEALGVYRQPCNGAILAIGASRETRPGAPNLVVTKISI